MSVSSADVCDDPGTELRWCPSNDNSVIDEGDGTYILSDEEDDLPVTFTLPIVEEAPPTTALEKEWLSMLGRIEILLLEDQDENGDIINRRLQVICLPSDSVKVSKLFRGRALEEESAAADEGHETSMLEQIASSFLDSCVSGPCAACAPVLPKSALRKSGEQRSENLNRSVTFDKIDIHEFNMTLGNHPSAVSGPPVAIDWDKEARVSSVTLDEYEASREPRRHRRQLKMSMKTRCGILQREANFSASEISEAWEEALMVRKQRRETLKGGMSQMVYDDFWESANRKMKRVTDSITGLALV